MAAMDFGNASSYFQGFYGLVLVIATIIMTANIYEHFLCIKHCLSTIYASS